MADETKELFQLLIDKDYDDFISRVAETRGLEKSGVDRVAQGQVWSGGDAIDNGLIDAFGTLEDAIATAAEMAELDEYGTKLIETELSATEQLAVELLGTAGLSDVIRPARSRSASPIDQLAALVEHALAPLAMFNDPRGSYAHCMCELD